jgi:hypothetical protein
MMIAITIGIICLIGGLLVVLIMSLLGLAEPTPMTSEEKVELARRQAIIARWPKRLTTDQAADAWDRARTEGITLDEAKAWVISRDEGITLDEAKAWIIKSKAERKGLLGED